MPLRLRFGEGAVAELRLESLRFKWAGSPDPDSSLGWKLELELELETGNLGNLISFKLVRMGAVNIEDSRLITDMETGTGTGTGTTHVGVLLQPATAGRTWPNVAGTLLLTRLQNRIIKVGCQSNEQPREPRINRECAWLLVRRRMSFGCIPGIHRITSTPTLPDEDELFGRSPSGICHGIPDLSAFGVRIT